MINKECYRLILILTILLVLSLAGCNEKNPTINNAPTAEKEQVKEDYTAVEVLEALKQAGLPIGKSLEYDTKTDPNKKLGRPGQYTGKVNFEDTNITEDDAELSESIETFANKEDLASRKNYIETVTKDLPGLQQYMYVQKNILLRLDFALTPEQAQKYQEALQKL